jgi:hypothetical protein
MRARKTASAVRHAVYRRCTSRTVTGSRPRWTTMRSHDARLSRDNGTKYFIAACAGMRPSRTAHCTASGKTVTSARRRQIQLRERLRRLASTSCLKP